MSDKPLAEMGKVLGELTQAKNEAYGDSFERCGSILRILYPDGIKPEQYRDALGTVRVLDKLFRIATRKNAFGESPWKDIAGYGILAATADEGAVREGLAKLSAEMQELESEPPKFKVGDRVRVRDDSKQEGVIIGTNPNDDEYPWRAEFHTDGNSTWVAWFKTEELKLEPKAEVPKAGPKFKVGDRVRIIDGQIQGTIKRTSVGEYKTLWLIERDDNKLLWYNLSELEKLP